MEGATNTTHTAAAASPVLMLRDEERPMPFARILVVMTKQEEIELRAGEAYWRTQHKRVKEENEALKQEIELKNARIKELEDRLFGKSSEKSTANSEQNPPNTSENQKRNRGQQPGSRGHGRTQRPKLPVVFEQQDLSDDKKCCPLCGLPFKPNPALDEQSDVIEVEVKGYIRRIHRPAYVRNQGCTCEGTPAIITAPPPPRLIPRSEYGVSFWVELILGKYQYGQPNHRQLQEFDNLGLPVSSGTLAGGLHALLPLFEPLEEALYIRQMNERVFHNDETRWEVFVTLPGKVGTRWYLWVTRSASVVFYCIDPSRSAAVPGAHFAGLQHEMVIIICDRYSAYKKLARLAMGILLAFCWAHMRRDFLEAGRAFRELEDWVLAWRDAIGTLYHLNNQRLEHWDDKRLLTDQSPAFKQSQKALETHLDQMYKDATKQLADSQEGEPAITLSRGARARQKKVLTSLIEHRAGLSLFVSHPEVPMDNNLAENSIRGPVNGRKNYYGSGSIWSARLAAILFSILQTLGLWGLNPRHWLTDYLQTCANNGGQLPQDLDSFLPWSMDEARRTQLKRPYCAQGPPALPSAPVVADTQDE